MTLPLHKRANIHVTNKPCCADIELHSKSQDSPQRLIVLDLMPLYFNKE